jgi:methylated-DNA-[protein]-cysteine S-methyltransferase
MLRFEHEGGCSALRSVPIHTDCGVFVAWFSSGGLAKLDFPRDPNASSHTQSHDKSARSDEWFGATREALLHVLSGRDAPALPPLDLKSGTAFQREVWQALQQIQCGKTRSYAEVATMVGRPRATRAVGAACGANPIPLLIPCHRVLAAGGKIGGFSGGLDWKLRLLRLEGVFPFSSGPKTEQGMFGFDLTTTLKARTP